jgi:FlaG/FlaF family flagellin (archaellin)
MEQRYPMKNNRGIEAVSEVIGTMLLLGMAVSLFMIVYVSVLTTSSSPPSPSSNIISHVDGDSIIMEHYGGDQLNLDTKIMITIDNTIIETTLEDIGSSLSWDSNNDGQWGMGEKLIYSKDGLSLEGKQISLSIVDVESNSVVMMGTLQG